MRLTSLTISGFKSFGDRTVVEFAPGVTAIIGPNGSGKSNIVDALRWVTGGGRARSFRADVRTELIFHGAAGKRSVGLAEVELELLSAAARPLRIYRSLLRDGSGTLKLNGVNARLIDVEEALTGTGLGRGALAVIGQGEVGEVLTADPERLLAYAAEAAGVAQLARRRELTLRRLDTARSHLVRLEDVIAELQMQVEALAHEAVEAERHEQLSREALQLGYSRVRRRVESLEHDAGRLRAKEIELQGDIVVRRDRLRLRSAELVERRGELADVEVALRKALAEAEARRGDLRVSEERLHSEELRRQDLEARAVALREQLGDLVLDEPDPPPGDAAELAAACERAEVALTSLMRSLEEVEAERSAAGRACEAAREASNAFEVRREALVWQLTDLRSRRGALEQSMVDEGEMTGERADLEERTVRLAEVRSEQVRLSEEIVELRSSLLEAEAEAGALERDLARHERAVRERRGYAKGPQLALTSGLPGVIGSVADLLEVPPRFRQAIGAALGRRVEHVVVETADDGVRVIEHVRRRKGWVTVLPLDLVPARRPRHPGIASESAVLGLAREVVKTDERFRSLVDQLLGATVIVTTLEGAVDLARAYGTRPLLVTLSGDRVESHGALSGGRVGVPSGLIGQRRGFRSALAKKRAMAAELTGRLEAVESEAARLDREERSLMEALGEGRVRLAALEEASHSRRRELSQIEDLEERVSVTLERLEAPAAFELAGATARLDRAEAAAAAVQEELLGARAGLDRARWSRGLHHERTAAYHALMTRVRRDRERRGMLADDLKRVEEDLVAVEREVERRRAAAASAAAALPDDLDTWEEAHRLAMEAVEAVETERARLTEEQARAGRDLEGVRLSLARRETALELARDEMAAYPGGLRLIDLSEREVRRRLAEVEGCLEEFGPVNHRAQVDFEERSVRLCTLRTDRDAALVAVEELEAALEWVDAETTARLNRTVEVLRKSFGRHVTALFGSGAVSDLRILRDEGRPTGLEVILQPPGKRTKLLNLLSVGERTMGALAFLFSLIAQGGRGEQSGLPIVVLDEVDAPLDEANIGRFCAFVERLAVAGTQFVLITHQRATFEIAEVISGVTTEGGVSRLFSIQKDEEELALRG